MKEEMILNQISQVKYLELKLLIIMLGIWIGGFILNIIFRKIGIAQYGLTRNGKIINVINERKYEIEYKKLGLFPKRKTITLRYAKPINDITKIEKLRILLKDKSIRFNKIRYTLDVLNTSKIKSIEDIKELIINIIKYEPTYKIDVLDINNENDKLPKVLKPRTNLVAYSISNKLIELNKVELLGYYDNKFYNNL